MIKLTDGELLDLLPASMKSDIDMVCLSYAIHMVTQDLLTAAAETQTQCFIDGLPERILDVLAVETNAMYYDESLPIEAKREIIRASISAWYARAGTPAAVEELVRAVVGEGEVVEWYDFTEGDIRPGLFDIVTNAPLTEDILAYFERMIRRVKNERSHLRRVLVERSTRASPHTACAAYSFLTIIISNGGMESRTVRGRENNGSIAYTFPTVDIASTGDRERTTSAKTHSGLYAHSFSQMNIM